jgi:hypothetical protein
MDYLKLKDTIQSALFDNIDDIVGWIDDQDSIEKTGGIEAVFSNAVVARLPIDRRCEVDLSEIGAASAIRDRHKGRLDCFIPSLDAALEFKAVRLPRRKSKGLKGARFDIGQIVADYHASSSKELMRIFHNQMYVDLMIARGDNQYSKKEKIWESFEAMGWHKPMANIEKSKNAFAIKVSSVGAICYRARI